MPEKAWGEAWKVATATFGDEGGSWLDVAQPLRLNTT
jgi:hypothetical protein